MTRIIALVALAVAAATLALALQGDPYPSRPVKIVIGFGAGAVADTPARLLAQKFSQTLGQQFVVENRPGAGSNIAAEQVARAPKDGYTLLMATAANTINVTIMPNLTFDFVKDFTPVAMVAAVPNLLVAHPSLGVNNVKELIALARSKPPGELVYGSSGVGTSTHLAGELINIMAGIKLTHVPYPGSGQSIPDALTGRIPLLFVPAAAAMQHVQSGALKAIAITQGKRAAVAPNVPTIAESGLPGYDIGLWFALMAPAGTPKEVIDKLSRAANDALKGPDVVDALNKAGIEVASPGTPEDLARFIDSEIKKGAEVAKAAGLAK
jgi:tripartite-type tricarboxylate transporter receptor subunit TctC